VGRGILESQKLAAMWISEGIDSVVFPSATGAGRNVVVYLANAAADSVVVRNRAEVWRPLVDDPWGSVAGKGFASDPQGASLFRQWCSELTSRKPEGHLAVTTTHPPSCPPTGVFLVRKLNFLAFIFAL
jgi:hypothetical protein